ncbi:MAG: 5-formyltetrahydrofolate cyclo-ligase [Verrucomicrobiota bacterium]
MNPILTPLLKSKQAQREHFKKVVATIKKEAREKASLQIQEQLFSLPGFKEGNTYFLFYSMATEPDTRAIFDQLILSGKRVAFPIWHQRDQRLSWHGVTAMSQLQRRENRIMEPEFSEQTEVASNQADVILVPGVAFDRQGYRLGRGAGMYDRTLASLKSETRKIGVFFSIQEADKIVVEPHDHRLDGIVTEREWIE